KLSWDLNPLTPTFSPAGRGSPALPWSDSLPANETGDATVDCRARWFGSAPGSSGGRLVVAAAQPCARGLRGDRRLARIRALGGAVLHRLHRGYRLRPRSGVAAEFHRGLFEL